MQANPEKSRAISLGKRGHDGCEDFTVRGITIKCGDSVKLLGVTFDYLQNFNLHISHVLTNNNNMTLSSFFFFDISLSFF